jgi:DNA-binding transcriptional MerR regulator
VKTIRYYSDLGLLPPSAVRGSGYRLYSDADRARLALVRALRDLDVDLASIARLLEAHTSVADTLALQLEAVEVRLRTLQRQRAVLRAAVARGGDGKRHGERDGSLAWLDRLRVFARLDAAERQGLVDRWLDRALDGVPADAAWTARFRAVARLDLPESPTDAQLDAWLELAELVTDDDFAARMRAVGEEAWSGPPADDARAAERRAVEADALALADAGADPSSEEARAVAARYVALSGVSAEALLARFDRAADPRAARYWALLAIVNGWPPAPERPQVRAYRWLHGALRAATRASVTAGS